MNFYTLIVLIAAFTGSVIGKNCGFSFEAPDPENDRIVHGVAAKEGAWPWIVPLLWNNSDSSPGVFDNVCGGTIIHRQWVVTAGHCFDGVGADWNPASNEADWQLEAGEHEVKTSGDNENGHRSVRHQIERIVVHEDYIDPFHPNDIAVIKIKGAFKYNRRVRPICLPDADAEFDEFQTSCYAAGWGQDFGTADNANVLQQIHSEVVNLDQCKALHGDDGAVHDESICYGDGRKGTCMGDSGGPLMCKNGKEWYLAGVTSWGHNECKDLPGVFTKTAAHREWILRQIAQFS